MPKALAARAYTDQDRATWRAILSAHRQKRERQICDIFLKGVEILNLREDHLPSLDEVNAILMARTGWRGILVEGLEEGPQFYRLLADRLFPVGNFIRSPEDLSYTPAPDIVHDLYGHLPFYTDRAYAQFCEAFGIEAVKYAERRDLLRQFERFFWFTVEFGLVETPQGRRIFGAGIASSVAECDYALSDKVEVLPFSVDAVCNQEFRIDEMQKRLFLLPNVQCLYDSLDELRSRMRKIA